VRRTRLLAGGLVADAAVASVAAAATVIAVAQATSEHTREQLRELRQRLRALDPAECAPSAICSAIPGDEPSACWTPGCRDV